MKNAHAGLNLQSEHFSAVAKHLETSLASFKVPQEDIDIILAHINQLKDDVLYN
jgi:hemoglobin